jgi:hypothetical protein
MAKAKEESGLKRVCTVKLKTGSQLRGCLLELDSEVGIWIEDERNSHLLNGNILIPFSSVDYACFSDEV